MAKAALSLLSRSIIGAPGRHLSRTGGLRRGAPDRNAGYAFTLNPRQYGKKFTVQLRAYDKAGNWKYSTKRTYHR
jgi:hypothetical protein